MEPVNSDLRSKNLPMVQVLRAFAALCVVTTHAIGQVFQIDLGFNSKSLASIGNFGVDVFFVISGFIMVWVTRHQVGSRASARQFLLRRIVRIAPLYWIFSLALILLTLTIPNVINYPVIDMDYWIKSLLFIPTVHPVDGSMTPILVVGWTLQFEMFFYLLFALSLLVGRKIGLTLLFSALVALAVADQFSPSGFVVLDYFTDPLLMEFAGGMVLGLLLVKGIRLPKWCSMGMVFISLCGLGISQALQIDLPRFIEFGVPAFLLVGAATLPLGAESHSPSKYSLALGNSSYALYLSHIFIIGGVVAIIPEGGALLGGQQPLFSLVFVSLLITLSAFMGNGVHLWVEQPMNRFFKTAICHNKPTHHSNKTPIASQI